MKLIMTKICILLLLSILVAVTNVSANNNNNNNKNLATDPWMNAQSSPEQRARILMSHMTSEEKRSMLYGTGDGESSGATCEDDAESKDGILFGVFKFILSVLWKVVRWLLSILW